MKALSDPDRLLADGLAAIRGQFRVPDGFPPEVAAAAEAAARRVPDRHADWMQVPFVTLDPASSTDLDQAFAIEPAGADLLLHYAIADVAWFVAEGDPLDVEAWSRGTTLYVPDGKAPLYPPVLSQGAASLLPDGPRPAVVFTVRVAPNGGVVLAGVERAVIRSRAKLAYETVRDEQLPPDFADLTARIEAAEARRGAARVDPPEQEVEHDGEGRFVLRFRPRSQAEDRNAALSLATNMAVADALFAAGTGLFRVMAAPDERAERRLRYTARALGLDWAAGMSLAKFEQRLDAGNPAQAAFMLAIRRAGEGASYVPYVPGLVPWHAAMAATYAHATAPLRRLADRYVVQAALAVANGQTVPAQVSEAFARLPKVMAKADARDGQIERAVIDLAEAAVLAGRAGETFAAIVTDLDERGARIPLGFALLAYDRDRRGLGGLGLLLPLALWLAFLPNAPYLVTDFVHLRDETSMPIWFDVALLTSFAWIGLMLGFVSVYLVQTVVRRHAGAAAGWALVLATFGACGVGVYVGRYLRLNTWDLVVRPLGVLGDVGANVDSPRLLGMSLVTAAFLTVAYAMLYTVLEVAVDDRGD
nr:putative ribonuclease II [uncultured bacterium]